MPSPGHTPPPPAADTRRPPLTDALNARIVALFPG